MKLQWTVEEIKITPSRADGVPDAAERVDRFNACNYARDLIRWLFSADRQQGEISNHVQILACYYIQLFYMFRSLRQEDAKMVSVAATFLACKVVDMPRKIKNIMRGVSQLRVPGSEPDLTADEERALCERVLKAEFLMLRIIQFQFDMELPLDVLGTLTEKLVVQLTLCEAFKKACKGPPQEEANALRGELPKVAERFMMDSFMGFAPLLAEPKVLAAGALAMATRYIRREMAIEMLCHLLNKADQALPETEVKHVVDEILNVFRTKANASGAAAAAAATTSVAAAPAAAAAAAA